MKETGLGPPERPLFDTFTRDGLVAEAKALGGSVIFTNHRENKLRYILTLLGVFLTSDGPRLETLMRKYLEVLRSLYLEDREIEQISSKVLESKKDSETESLIFSASELQELRLIMSLSLDSFSSRFSGASRDEWFIRVTDDVVELKNVGDWSDYIRAQIMKRYDPKEPVTEAERLFHSTAPKPINPDEGKAEYPGGATWVDKEFDPHVRKRERFFFARALKSIGTWFLNNILGKVLVAVIVALVLAYLAKIGPIFP